MSNNNNSYAYSFLVLDEKAREYVLMAQVRTSRLPEKEEIIGYNNTQYVCKYVARRIVQKELRGLDKFMARYITPKRFERLEDVIGVFAVTEAYDDRIKKSNR